MVIPSIVRPGELEILKMCTGEFNMVILEIVPLKPLHLKNLGLVLPPFPPYPSQYKPPWPSKIPKYYTNTT